MEPDLKSAEETAATQEEAKKEPTLADKLRELLADFDNAPSAAVIDSWKAKHGDIYLSALNDDEVFIFRALTRKEHRLFTEAAQKPEYTSDFDEDVVKACVIWKGSDSSLDSKAGTIPSLYEQVMQNSNFLAPQLLSNLVTKL